MSPDKILYVDDEPMALKYFERLVSPLAPVITALSVEQGKAVLRRARRRNCGAGDRPAHAGCARQ
ncbi:hypothetical protein LP414_13080 [Polaromonas sp. P1(28)-13]|nr:hypothetical protein LP414_13080 [Polaromonas sp. P1(28)-13]